MSLAHLIFTLPLSISSLKSMQGSLFDEIFFLSILGDFSYDIYIDILWFLVKLKKKVKETNFFPRLMTFEKWKKINYFIFLFIGNSF